MPLSADEEEIYRWQMWVSDFGASGQEKLRGATVFVSRVGGLGGQVAYQLAAAGIGRLILAHAGNVKPSDLNRQLLMTHDWIGKPRLESARRRLLELNPRIEIDCHPVNVTTENAAELTQGADVIVDCAPLFEERWAMNAEAVRSSRPLVECAMYELEASLTVVRPHQSACLACLTPDVPTAWKREFPVFGAVSGAVGCLATMETIKLIAGFGEVLTDTLLKIDLRSMEFRRLAIHRNPRCRVCGDSD